MAADETFLIVDDARLARKMVRAFVNKARPDITVFEAADGADALRILDTIPKLTYTSIDYNMPGMNGLEVATIIKERRPDARIALVTANVQSALRNRASDIGISFIDKPINESKIAAFVAPSGA